METDGEYKSLQRDVYRDAKGKELLSLQGFWGESGELGLERGCRGRERDGDGEGRRRGRNRRKREV